jgi:ABC-2 type transport system permease protein
MNPIGFRTLLKKEMRRFLRVPGQTLAQPVVTTTLYFLVFGYALGGRVREVDGVPYDRFIVPGLMLLGLSQNAFLNTSSSMFIAKLQGTIVDLLVAPLSVADLLLAFTLAAVVRGLLVGGIVWAISALFTGFEVSHPIWVLTFGTVVAATFGLVGLVVAIWSDKFEQLNIVPTFIITPLTFLGGVFYSAQMLPRPWNLVCRVNPVLYMVEGIRYGVVGSSTSSPWVGLAVTGGVGLLSLGLAIWMLATGYKLRS